MDMSPLISRSNTQYEPIERVSNSSARGSHVRTLFAGCRNVDCMLSEWRLACSISTATVAAITDRVNSMTTHTTGNVMHA